MISCLLCDFDGTLVDTVEANIKSYSQAFNDAGVRFDEQLYRKEFGLRYPEIMDKLLPKASPKQLTMIKGAKAKYYKKNLSLINLNRGLFELLGSAKKYYKIGLVTTASPENVNECLNFFNIDREFFDIIITGKDVSKGKPNPECYLKAVDKLSVSPDQCIIFEDNAKGLQAAKSAGIQSIKVAL